MQTIAPAESETVEAVDGVHLTPLVVADHMSVQHFHVERESTVPEHSHEHEQVGYITQGTLTLVVDGEEHVISPGESYAIPGDTPHAAENTGEVPVDGVDVFSPPRTNPDWLD